MVVGQGLLVRYGVGDHLQGIFSGAALLKWFTCP
jgi:hypothetical protein